jgi:Tfp pilus assembly protein PilF
MLVPAKPVHRSQASEGVRCAFAALVCLALAGCATPAPAPVDPVSLLLDSAFLPQSVPANPEVLVPSDAMRRYLAVDIARELRNRGKLHGLVAALEGNTRLKLSYDSTITRTAAEAFEARAGNCLSLTVMTAALARELGLSVSFHRVLAEPLWTRSGDTLFASGHVNVVLAPALASAYSIIRSQDAIIVDFLPGADPRKQRSHEILEHTVTAMYMNNRAAEAIPGGSLDEAYWWARGALLHDSRFLEGINTLGVVYSRHGNAAQAERAFRYVLSIETENVSAMANLAGVLERSGRQVESLALRDRLRQIESQPPFHFFDLGMAALRSRDFEAAQDHFLRELRRNAYYHEAHFGLAIAYLHLGKLESARKHLGTALETSTNRGEQDLYAGKLAWLRSIR